MDAVSAHAEQVARAHYARLRAYLAARFRDLSLAEDALGAALLKAMEVWPIRGIPDRPDAWLYQVARRHILDALRHVKRSDDFARQMAPVLALEADLEAGFVFPDERLKLLYTCAHPALSRDIHVPLMLQTVLGFEASDIARAFAVPAATMSQRLVRAKAKIREAGIPFVIPEASELPGRMESVLAAVYAGFGIAWDEWGGDDDGPRHLSAECLELARWIAGLSDGDPEALGLLSLLLFSEARKSARFTVDGDYVPLSEQDTALWDRDHMREAAACLNRAFRKGRIGRFQLEAAIQNAHVEARLTGQDISAAVLPLYEGLCALYPSLGVRVAHAVAVSKALSPTAGLAYLDSIAQETVRAYQPYWASRADILRHLGDRENARACYMRAMGLTADPAVRRFLEHHMIQLDQMKV